MTLPTTEELEHFIQHDLTDIALSKGMPVTEDDVATVTKVAKMLREYHAAQETDRAHPSTWETEAREATARIKLLEQVIFDTLDARGLMGSGLHDLEEEFYVDAEQAEFIRACGVNHDINYPTPELENTK